MNDLNHDSHVNFISRNSIIHTPSPYINYDKS